LINAQQPISAAPSVSMDRDGQIWVNFGTGRFATRVDSNDQSQQSFYGIKEDVQKYKEVHKADLLDVSDAAVYNTGKVTGLEDIGITEFSELMASEELEDGWFMNFPNPGERNIGQPAVLGDLVSFTTYVPNNDLCLYEGASYLYALYNQTGTSFPGGGFELNSQSISEVETINAVSLGQGLAITPNFHVGRAKGSKAFIQISSGGIPTFQLFNPGVTKTGRAGWREE
jgi:type IV pilus assembly protein PilY1